MEIVLLDDMVATHLTSRVRQCRDCGEVKPVGEFPRSKPRPGPSYPQGRCKPCQNAWSRIKRRRLYQEDLEYRAKVRTLANRWRKSNPEIVARIRVRGRVGRRLKKYGITEIELSQMFADQGGKCSICEAPLGDSYQSSGTYVVDHDHQIGTVRSLLCDACNVGIGKFRDNIDFVQAARQYLRHWNSRR